MIKGLVFDFDGLILDTESAEYKALQWIYGQYGQALSMEIWGARIGTQHEFDPIEHLKEIANLQIPAHELRRVYRAQFCRLIRDEGPMPGVVDYLEAGKRLGLRLAVASSSPLGWVEGFLEDLGLTNYFDALCTADDVDVVKPDPALYNIALQRLGITASEAVAFEDSPNGALAAKRAGLYCVIIPNSVTKGLEFGDYDLKLNSMADLPLERLLEALLRRRSELIS